VSASGSANPFDRTLGSVASDGPAKHERKPVGSAVDAFEDAIRAQLPRVLRMPATVIMERVG